VTGTPLDQREREELCDLLLELGPDAPTLCEGWRTLDLAAHLAAREREPWAAGGLMFDRLAPFTEKRRMAWKAKGLEAAVATLRPGPPLWYRLPGVRSLVNLNEWAIHHEDVRRANGQTRRADRDDLDQAIWRGLRRGARFLTRRVQGAGVDLVLPGGERAPGKGEPRAELRGRPLELLLYLSGRRRAAEVELAGPDAAVAAVEHAAFGL
jgi:uncharacterized protein (TIGR03085 family)